MTATKRRVEQKFYLLGQCYSLTFETGKMTAVTTIEQWIQWFRVVFHILIIKPLIAPAPK